jgi:hypothetical protein
MGCREILATETVSTIPDKHADSQQRGDFSRCEARQEVLQLWFTSSSPFEDDDVALGLGMQTSSPQRLIAQRIRWSDFARSRHQGVRGGKMLEKTTLDYALVMVFAGNLP